MTTENRDRPRREERLGFRVDEPAKALSEAAARAIVPDETLVLSERDQAVFFDAVVEPPPPSERLQPEFADHRRRIAQ